MLVLSCQSPEYVTSLTITNSTDKIISFDYDILFSMSRHSWSYQGTATIAPNATVDVETISTDPTDISTGTFTVQATNITYD